jgi:hypothetical protein
MKRSIEITVSPTGDASVEAIGFKGADCEKATRFIEEALGEVKTRQRTPEYHQTRQHNQKHTLGS